MDTSECQPLYQSIQKFYEALGMKIEQHVPLLLVERQALNEAREGEKNVRTLDFQLCISNMKVIRNDGRTDGNILCFYL